ncbi:glutamate cyclase domain-containing protein [Lentibacillus sp. N15]|uniref:glutamate cyclase domain-containing protein n=1 Tax=Lentibacillus songyuanensis TaxID=3136161 RepID=UPI0031B9FDFE
MITVCENIDRLITVESRLPSLPRGIAHLLYYAVRSNEEPLTYQIASEMKKRIEDNRDSTFTVGIFTGVWDPKWLPNGENDGPIGAVVLGKALYLAGAEVKFFVEKEIVPVMKALCTKLGVPATFIPLSREDDYENESIADELNGAVFIEKIGPSKEGVYHFASGLARGEHHDAPLELLLNKLRDNGKVTVGIGDMGNEIGFGKIYDEARKIHPFGEICKCKNPDGLVTKLATEYLLPSSISNLGAYGLAAAIALLTENLDILHKPEDELALIHICAEMDCRDGGFGKAHHYVDGVQDRSIAAYVRLLQEMVTMYFNVEERGF